jgi:hypothetical protein
MTARFTRLEPINMRTLSRIGCILTLALATPAWADDDREDAEALGERREDDREAADLTGRVGVPPDRSGGQAGQDPDADAGSDDTEGRKGAEVFHVPCCLRGPGLNPGSWVPWSGGQWAASTAWMVASADSAASCSWP